MGPEYYVNVLSFVDQTQLEPGCTVLLHNKVCFRPSAHVGQHPVHPTPGLLHCPHKGWADVERAAQVLSVVGLLQDEADPMVSVMKVSCPSTCLPDPCSLPIDI